MISARSTLSPSFTFVPSFLFLPLVLLAAPSAQAQTHWDATVQAGASMRAFSGNANVAGLNGNLGGGVALSPTVGLTGSFAVIPLLRLGLYADYEYAQTGEPKSPSLVSFGGRVKLMIPGYRGGVHWWLFTGIGGVLLEAPAYSQQVPNAVAQGGLTTETVSSTSGYFAEIPLGIGMGWRMRKPWELVAELQGRFGFAMNGSYFTDDGSGNGLTRPSSGINAEPTGTDVVALLLTVGIALDQ